MFEDVPEMVDQALTDMAAAANSLENVIDHVPPKYKTEAFELLRRLDDLLEKWSDR